MEGVPGGAPRNRGDARRAPLPVRQFGARAVFVDLLGELRRWGLAPEAVDSLLPNAERALDWIDTYGDADGDGYVEYKRAADRGLANPGGKDSWAGIRI